MNYGPLIFLAAFLALSGSWFGLVLGPQVQVGREEPTNTVGNVTIYPTSRPGIARQGEEVYRANGCFYCHSQQVRQQGVTMNVMLTSVGTNPVAVAEALLKANVGITKASGPGLAAGLPKAIIRGVSLDTAKIALKELRGAGGDAKLQAVPTGPDISRGWGVRRTVSRDFLYDTPVMPGSQRVGPDLANVGARLIDANWHLRHLYDPRIDVKDSTMPGYPFLFERRKIGRQASADALQLPKDYPIDRGFEIVPTDEAKALAAYLLSLRADAPIFETPMPVALASAAAATNAPAAATNAPAAATNAPAK